MIKQGDSGRPRPSPPNSFRFFSKMHRDSKGAHPHAVAVLFKTALHIPDHIFLNDLPASQKAVEDKGIPCECHPAVIQEVPVFVTEIELSQYLKHIYGLLHLSQYLIMSTCHMCFAGTILNSPYHGSLGHCPYIPSFCFVDRKAEIVLSSYAGSCPDGGILLIPALLACFMCAEASF